LKAIGTFLVEYDNLQFLPSPANYKNTAIWTSFISLRWIV